MTAPNPLSYQLVTDSWRLIAEVLGLGRFGREWCGIGSHTTFLEARRLLVQTRYIDELPPMYSKEGQRLALYRPGEPQ